MVTGTSKVRASFQPCDHAVIPTTNHTIHLSIVILKLAKQGWTKGHPVAGKQMETWSEKNSTSIH